MQLAVFELSKQFFSPMNNEKIFESVCLDISKAFDCIGNPTHMVFLKLF